MASKKRSLADVFVGVIPETSHIAERLSAAFREVDPKAREAGKRWGREIQQGLGDIDVDLNTKQAQAKVDKLSSDVEDHDREMPVDADTSSARRAVDVLDARIEGRTRTMRVDVDRTALSRLGGSLSGSSGVLKTNAIALAAAGIPALATGLTQVLGGIQQIAQAGLALPGIFTAAASSLGTAVLGFQGVGDAISTMWDAAASGDPKDLQKAQEALQKLAPAAREVVGAVAELRPQLMGLKATAQQHIFADLSDDLTRFGNSVLPTVNAGLAKMADSWNATFAEMMRVGGMDSTKGMFSRIFGDSAQAQQIVNGAIEPLTNALGKLSVAGADALPRIANGVVALSNRFSAAIDKWSTNGQLDKWINESLTGLTELGNAFLNVGKILNSLTTAAGGGSFLQWLETATSKLANFMALPSTQASLQNFFRQGAADLRQWGDLLKSLIPVLQGVLDGAHRWGTVLLPILTDVANVLGKMPGLISAVVTAFLAWRTISGITSLMTKLTGVGTALTGLPGKATFAANGINKALSLIVVPEIGKMLNDQLDQWLAKNHPTLDRLNHTNTPGSLGKSTRDWVNDHMPWLGKHLPGYKDDSSDNSPNALDLYRKWYPNKPATPTTSDGLPYPNTQGITKSKPVTKSNPLPVTIANPPAIPASAVTPSAAIPASTASAVIPAVSGAIPMVSVNPNSNATRIPLAPNVEAGINAVGGLPTLYPTSGAGAYQVPAWAQRLAKMFGLTASTYSSGGSLHQMGYAMDFNGSPANMDRFAQFIENNLAGQTLQLIHRSTITGKDYGIASGQRVGPGTSQPGYYAANWAGHGDHVHWATDIAPMIGGKGPKGTKSDPLYTTAASSPAVSSAASGGGGKARSQGQQLGQGLVDGLLQEFGFDGSVFGDPRQFGIFKLLKGIMGIKLTGKALGGGDGASLPGIGALMQGMPGLSALTSKSGKGGIANAIFGEALKRGYSGQDALAIIADAIGESSLNPGAKNGNHLGLFQQDASYPGRTGGASGQILGFFDRLAKAGGSNIYDKIVNVQKGGYGPDWIKQFVPQANNLIANTPSAFGDLAIGRQQEAPAPFMPALPASTSVNLPSPKAPGAPQQQAPQQRGGNQMTVNQTFNGVTPDEAMQRGRERMQGPARAMLNSMPR